MIKQDEQRQQYLHPLGLLLCRSMTFKDLADKVDQMLYEIKRGSKKAIGYMECFYNFI